MLRIRFEKRAKKAFMWRYGHGRFADAWVILHIFSGFTAGIIGLLLGLGPLFIFTLSVFLFTIYELWEAYVSIVEDLENALVDILAGATGVTAVLAVNKFHNLETKMLINSLILVLVIDAILLYFGWRTYLKRRMSGQTLHEYPGYNTNADKRTIKRDQVAFAGFSLLMIASPGVYFLLGVTALGVFLLATLAIIYGLRHKL